MKRLAILTTHPIQYNAPWFKLLAQRNKVAIKVFYSWGKEAVENKHDPGFGKVIEWDIPLLDGYEYEFLENTATKKGSHYFNGIVNPDIIEKIKAYQPDAVLIFGWAFNSHLKAMRYFKGKIPVYFRGDSTVMNDHAGFSVRKLMRRSFLNWIYRHIDIALYVGTKNKEYFLKHGLKENMLVLARHAVDNARFEVADEEFEKEASDIRRGMNIPEEAIVFLYAGKLEAIKNPSLLVEGFLKHNHPNSHLVLIGNGVLEDQLKEKASGHNNIHFMPFKNQSEMPVVYRIGDVFVLTSFSETWGLGVNEAMACGRAILISDTCGCVADLVEGRSNGYVFEGENAAALANAMDKMSDKKLLSRMGDTSQCIIQDFSFENICEAIEKSLLA